VQSQAELLQAVPALGAAGGFASLLDGRQKQGDENRDNRNHHQQFDQRKTTTTVRSASHHLSPGQSE
jgi:hypothetical protein